MGLLDFLETPQGQALASGIATYAATAQRGTPWNNIGRGLLGAGMSYADSLEKDKAKKAWEQIVNAGKKQVPTFETVNKPGFQFGDTFYDTPEEAYKAAGIDPSRALTRGIGGEPIGVDVRSIGIDGSTSIAPDSFFKVPGQYTPHQIQQDGVPLPNIQQTNRLFTVPGTPKEVFDPNAALRAAMQSGNMEIASKVAPIFSAYAKAEQDQLENKALEDVQTALKSTGGDAQKAVKALLDVGNYKGATALMNAMSKTGMGDPTAQMKNYEFRKALKSPEEQAMFDNMLRAQQWLNTGDQFVRTWPIPQTQGSPSTFPPNVQPTPLPANPADVYVPANVPGTYDTPNRLNLPYESSGANSPKGLPGTLKINPKPDEQPDFKRRQAKAVEIGKSQGETENTLNAAKASFPQLDQTVSDLKEIGKNSTFTYVGQAKDAVARQLGIATPGAVSREKYIQTVRDVLFPQLRATFGPQFTVKEGEALIATLGDPDKTPQERNAALDSFIEQKKRTIESLGRQSGGFTESKPNRAAPIQGEGFKMLPNAKEWEANNPTKTLKDTKTGKRYRATGGKWVEVK